MVHELEFRGPLSYSSGGNCYRFRGGRRREGFAVLQPAPGRCLSAPCSNELSQKFPAARVGWGPTAAATRHRGCAEREGPRHRHPLHRWKVASVSEGWLPARLVSAGRGRCGVTWGRRTPLRPWGGAARAPLCLGGASAEEKTRVFQCPLLGAFLSLRQAVFASFIVLSAHLFTGGCFLFKVSL